jgi:trigger factor
MKPDDVREFDMTFPEDEEIQEHLRGKTGHFTVTLKELREKVLPDADDDFASSFGEFTTLQELRTDIQSRLERNAIDRARHDFADKIIDYAVANATLELPDVLIEQEVEVMHDEFRNTLARQGIAETAYLQATGQTEADLHTEFRPSAEKRTKTLLVLTEIARAEGVTVPEADIEAEVERARERYSDKKVVAYFESERGHDFIRSTLRRTRVVEGLVDAWLAEHPEHPPLLHLEDQEAALATPEAEAAASIGATDPGSLEELEEHTHQHPEAATTASGGKG